DLENSFFTSVAIAGPGFINFTLGSRWFSEAVAAVLTCGENYGRSDYGKGQKVMVEYVSANPTGPMHMGNARGGAIGDVLAEALAWSGHDTTREFYVNDAGNQIEKFG
ncbi:MAG: arginine--tRNA ligase, partial [Angelakisella sp.]